MDGTVRPSPDIAPVLVVEDDPVVRRYLCDILAARGFTTVPVPDVASAVSHVRHAPVDLVLCDVDLPDGDGVRLAGQLIGTIPDVAVIMVTAADDLALASRVLAMGAFGYLVKPLRPIEVLVSVEGALQRRRLERTDRQSRLLLEERVAERTAQLTDAIDRAGRAERSRTEFIQNVSHELRTPLTSILAAAPMLGRDDLEPDRVAAIGAMIGRQGGRLHSLIERLLQVAASTRLGDDELLPLDVGGLLADAAIVAQDLGTPCVVEVAPDVGGIGDAQRLATALAALVDNAVRFSQRSPVELRAIRAQGALELLVVDRGPGIPARERTRMIEPFVQGDGSVTRQHGGMGLGLFLAQGAARWHGGELTLDETPGGGVTARLRIPDASVGLTILAG